ncbi:DUF4974 domain-containing protein [Hymenobacter koreensis]|uniref:Secretin/TonB short N-terminal domain-containing protein n=1 Tax=Hymenobacter koreensis TaxID=1084523 RepID=A0ABP8IX03_9BACT
MRHRICLATAVLCALAGSPSATNAQVRPGSVMERKVTVTFNQAPLESVLRTLRRQYGVRISYSNTALDLQQPVTLSVQNQPLRAVLNELLRDKNIGYELVGDQVVLHRAQPKVRAVDKAAAATVAATTTTVSKATVDRAPNAAPLPGTGTGPKPTVAPAESSKPHVQEARVPVREAPKNKVTPKSNPVKPTTAATKSKGVAVVSSKPNSAPTSDRKDAKPTEASVASGAKGSTATAETPSQAQLGPVAAPADEAGATASTSTSTPPAIVPTDSVARNPVQPTPTTEPAAKPEEDQEPEAPTRPTYTKTAQISFLGPLGSNGLRSGQTVNTFSLNVLGGYSAGVDGVEAAGLFNVSRDSVTGLQVAGLANVVGKRLQGYQGAGLANVLGGSGEGWQSAGLFNVATRPMAGAQTAGLFNYSGPAKTGTADGEFLVQAGGLFNVSLGEVRGVQAAGLFNVARNVRGVQLAGLLNIADSVNGVSLAPLNLVRHGYHRLELTNSETWLAQANLKLGGSPHFYTFFTGAIQPGSASKRRWGLGYGVGSEVLASHRFSFTLDAVAVQVSEEPNGWTDYLNLQNQFRLLMGYSPFRAGGRVRVVAGPVLSILVTQRYDAELGGIGSGLTEGRTLLLDEGNASSRVLGWVGYTTGIRF